MSRYRRGSHTIYEIKYHLVWVTKYRYHVLKGKVAHRARELIRQTCLDLDVRIEKGPRPQGPRARVGVGSTHGESFESDEADKRSIVTQRFLRSKLQQEFAHLRKRYWGRHFWARGYFCATSGRLTEEQIRNYIEGHDQEPPDSDFTVGQ